LCEKITIKGSGRVSITEIKLRFMLVVLKYIKNKRETKFVMDNSYHKELIEEIKNKLEEI